MKISKDKHYIKIVPIGSDVDDRKIVKLGDVLIPLSYYNSMIEKKMENFSHFYPLEEIRTVILYYFKGLPAVTTYRENGIEIYQGWVWNEKYDEPECLYPTDFGKVIVP